MAEMITATRKVLSNYSGFSGRASRPEYWWWILATCLLQIATQIIDGAVIAPVLGLPVFSREAGDPLSALVALGLLLPHLAVGARRLHDTGRSGWWLLLMLLPVIGALVLLYFFVQRSDEGDNGFGPPEPLTGAS